MDEIGYVNRCGGIPKYPIEYDFHLDESISENRIRDSKKRVSKFLEKYGYELSVDDLD